MISEQMRAARIAQGLDPDRVTDPTVCRMVADLVLDSRRRRAESVRSADQAAGLSGPAVAGAGVDPPDPVAGAAPGGPKQFEELAS